MEQDHGALLGHELARYALALLRVLRLSPGRGGLRVLQDGYASGGALHGVRNIDAVTLRDRPVRKHRIFQAPDLALYADLRAPDYRLLGIYLNSPRVRP